MLAFAVFGLYAKSITFDWQYLDDDVLILEKQDYLKLSNIKTMFTDTFFGVPGDTGYRPLLNVSFAIDRTISGLNPVSYHISNILIFLFAVFSIYLLFSYKNDKTWSFFFSLIIAVNPLLCAVVCRPVDRSDSLLTLFVVLSFYFLIKYLDCQQKCTINNKKTMSSFVQPFNFLTKQKTLFFSLHTLFFVLALFTKETAILAPLLYIMFIFFSRSCSSVIPEGRCRESRSLSLPFIAVSSFIVHCTSYIVHCLSQLFNCRRSRCHSERSEESRRSPFKLFNSSTLQLFNCRCCTLYIIHYTLYIIIYFSLRHIAVGSYSSSGTIVLALSSILNNSVSLIKYFYNLIFPITDKLSFSQDIFLFVLTLLIFMFIFVKAKYKNITLLLFAFFAFVLFLVPTMLMSNHMYSYFQNRIFLSMVCAYYVLLNCLQKYKTNTNKIIIFWLIFVIVIYTSSTFFRMNRYQNRWTAFTGELIDTPDSPYINAKFGMLLADVGMYEQAEERLNTAISLEPYNYMHYENLALVYYRAGDIDKAKSLVDYAQELKASLIDYR